MYGRVNLGGAILALNPGIVAPSGIDVTNPQKAERITQGTPAVLSSYTPSDGSDRLLIVFGALRAGSALGSTTKTFGASSFALPLSASPTSIIADLSLGTGTGTAAADITMSFTDTGSDTCVLAAMTAHGLAQATAEATASSGGMSTYDTTDNIDATISGHTSGALVVSMCFSHTATALPTIDGSGAQTEVITMSIGSGNRIYAIIGWSEAPSTANVVHRYHVAANGNNAAWLIGAWAPA